MLLRLLAALLLAASGLAMPVAQAALLCEANPPTPACVAPATGGATGACLHKSVQYPRIWCAYAAQRGGELCAFVSYAGSEREVACQSDATQPDPLCADTPDPPCVAPITGDAHGSCMQWTGWTCAYVRTDDGVCVVVTDGRSNVYPFPECVG